MKLHLNMRKITTIAVVVLFLVVVNLSVKLNPKICPGRSFLPVGAFPNIESRVHFKESHAIAAWARRYNADCVMCHTMVPRLNQTGLKFRRLGYQMPDEFDNREHGYEKTWEELSKFQDYVSVRARSGAIYRRQSGVNTFSFSDAGAPPPDMTLFYAGPISRNISMFSEFAFDPDAAAFEVGQAMLHFGTSDRFFTVRSGKFHDFGKVGAGGLDRPIGISFNQAVTKFINGYRPRTDQIGVEAGYSWGGFTGLVQATNGIKPTGDAVGGEVDPNTQKDIGLLLEYLIPNHEASVSALFVYGQAPTPQNNAGAAVAGAVPTKYARGYLFADYTFESIGLKPIVGFSIGSDNQFITGIGTTKAALTSGSRSTSWITFAEFDQRITDTLYGIARFNYFDPTNKAESSAGTARTWVGTGGFAWSFQRYGKLTAEYTVTDNKFQNTAHAVNAELQVNF